MAKMSNILHSTLCNVTHSIHITILNCKNTYFQQATLQTGHLITSGL